MNKAYIIPALLGIVALLFVGGAFASESSAAYVQAVQLQINLDKAIAVGNAAITHMNASVNDSGAVSNLTATLNQLVSLRASIDANSTTIDQVQANRKQAMQLVTSFRQQAQKLLSPDAREQIKDSIQADFEQKHKDTMNMIAQLRKAVNLKNFEAFSESQQQAALGLNASDNVSLVPELQDKLADVRSKIEADDVSADEVAQLRTQIKADVESIKANRSETIAQIRASQLKLRVEVMERLIANATAANITTADLQTSHDAMVNLLSAYASGNITADVFADQAHDLLEQSTKLVAGPQFAGIRGKIMSSVMSMRVEVRNESKQDWQDWKDERASIMMQINQTHGQVRDMMRQIRENQSEARDDLRQAVNAQRGENRMPALNGDGRRDGSRGGSANVNANGDANEDGNAVSVNGSAAVSVTG